VYEVNQANECEARRKGAHVNISPHLGRVPYGAKELQRVYKKQMSLAFIFAVALTLAVLSSLRFYSRSRGIQTSPAARYTYLSIIPK
jgi:hypothetical protein